MRAAVDGNQSHAAVGRHFAAQEALRRVEANFYTVAGWIGDIERFRNQVILRAVSQARCLEAGCRVGEIAAAGNVDGDVEEIARLLRQRQLGAGMEHDQRPAADAKLRLGYVLAKRCQPKRVAPDIQGRRHIGYPQMDRPETSHRRQQSFVHRRLSDCGRRHISRE